MIMSSLGFVFFQLLMKSCAASIVDFVTIFFVFPVLSKSKTSKLAERVGIVILSII